NTIDEIISQVSADHLILTGISSVDAPITLKNYGFEVISKLFSSDKYRVFRIVCEGGNNRALGKYMIRYFRKI
ncbi:hypothetical protein DJ528_10635, partial [Sulfolobus sp. B5]